MLNEGLASWSDIEAMTCWGKPKQIMMHIKDVVEEYILYIAAYTNTKFTYFLNMLAKHLATSNRCCTFNILLHLNCVNVVTMTVWLPMRMREHSEEELAGGGFTCSISSSLKWLSSRITL